MRLPVIRIERLAIGTRPDDDAQIFELIRCGRLRRLARRRSTQRKVPARESRAAAVDQWAGDVTYSISQNLVSTSDAVTAANATRNAVMRSWIMAAG